MKTFHDILSDNREIVTDSKDCRNYIYQNLEKSINYVILKSKDTQCIICKECFSSLHFYVLHLRSYKKHVVEFVFRRMLTSEKGT